MNVEFFAKVDKESRFYKDREEFYKNLQLAQEHFRYIKDKYEIEASEFYITSQLKIVSTETDRELFKSSLLKDGETFRKNSPANKEWEELNKDFNFIQPYLGFYVSITGRSRQTIFKSESGDCFIKITCESYNLDRLKTCKFLTEIKGSEYYKESEALDG